MSTHWFQVPAPENAHLIQNPKSKDMASQLSCAITRFWDTGGDIDRVFDPGFISVYLRSSHSPLLGTVVADSVPCIPLTEVSDSGEERLPIKLDVALEYAEAIETMVGLYRAKVRRRKVHLFMSSGFDSRLELAMLLHSTPSENVTLHSFDEGAEATEIVRLIALRLGLRLNLLPKFSQWGPKNSELADFVAEAKFDSEPIWRPTVPYFGAVVGSFGSTDEMWLGYTPWELKGRYDRLMPLSAPTSDSALWRLRPTIPLRGYGLRSVKGALGHQTETWKRLRALTSHLRDDQQQDFASWALSYGFGYAARMRLLGNLGLEQISATEPHASLFFRLDRDVKDGTTFVRRALSDLLPELSDVPVLSSSDHNKHANSSPKPAPPFRNLLASLRLVSQRMIDTIDSGERKHLAKSRLYESLGMAAEQLPAGQAVAALQMKNFITRTLIAAQARDNFS